MMEMKELESELICQAKRTKELREMLFKVLDFYHMETQEWVKKYGPGLTTKQLGDEIRFALASNS